jgi:DNA-binding NarL/FixJ family response regulator
MADHIQRLVDAILDFVAPEAATPSITVPGSPRQGQTAALNVPLTVREIEVLTLLARGLSNREMGDRLVLSPRTIERHLENVYRKTGARNRAEATAYAFTNGLLERSDHPA